MNSFGAQDLQRGERILRQERIHRGIFFLPLILFGLCLIPLMAFWRLMDLIGNLFGQLGQSHANPQLPSILWLLPVGLCFLPALGILAVAIGAYLNSEIVLTNKRLICRIGFLIRAADELPLANIDSISIFEPLLGRLFGYGTVAVTSLGGVQFPLRFMGHPQVFHAALQNAMAEEKSTPVARKTSSPPDDDSRYMPKW